MPATKCYAQVRGSVIRATRLDSCGVPDPGASAVAVSKRISTISLDPVTDDGNNIRERGFDGQLCIVDDAMPSIIGWTGDIALCGVDPDLISLFTGQPVVKNAAGDTVGFDATTNVDLDSFGYALEVWTRIAGGACTADGQRLWGYTVFPYFKGGRIGGFSFEDAAVQFTISGAQTRDGNGWGAGPFDVDRGAGPDFDPAPLFTALGVNTHFRNIMVSLDPPAASCGAIPLAA